jgi:DNA (cytosine-5)-methyltransferase 1
MRGFTSAYKRMSYDKPASALTRNLSYACSDNKLHPEQNRVLSLFEAFRLHTVDRYPYQWQRPDGRRVNDKTIREIIGESIPPAGFQIIVEHLRGIYLGTSPLNSRSIHDPDAEMVLA